MVVGHIMGYPTPVKGGIFLLDLIPPSLLRGSVYRSVIVAGITYKTKQKLKTSQWLILCTHFGLVFML